MKKDWTGRPAGITGTGYYHERDADAVLIWSGYRVYLRATLNREPDRPVFLEMTPDQADDLARDLTERARRARELNQESGTTRRDPLADR